MEYKGALRTIAREYASEIRDGIAWVIVWKTGRNWHAEAVWLDPDTELLEQDDLATVRGILDQDPNAVILNGYYCGHFWEDMTINELVAGIRWHYEGGHNLLASSGVFPEETMVQSADIQMDEFQPQDSTQKDFMEKGRFEELIGRHVTDQDYEVAEMSYLFHPAFRAMNKKEFVEFYQSLGKESFYYLHPGVKKYHDLVSHLRYTHEAIAQVEKELAELKRKEVELKELKQKMWDAPGAFENHAWITYRVDALSEKEGAAGNGLSPPSSCKGTQKASCEYSEQIALEGVMDSEDQEYPG